MIDEKTKNGMCKDCKWFDRVSDLEEIGFCHRYPPIGGDSHDIFPLVDIDDWCGEFKRRENK